MNVPLPSQLTAPTDASISLEATIQALLNAPDADSTLVVDREGTLLALNAVAARRLGKPLEELVGTCLYSHFEPSLAASRRAHSEEVFRTGKAKQYVDNRIGRVFDNHVQPVLDGDETVQRVVIFARDITDQYNAEREVARLESFFHLVLENLPAELAVFDTEGHYLYVNPAAVHNLDMRQWLIGKTDTDYWNLRERDLRSGPDPASDLSPRLPVDLHTIAQARAAALRQCVETGKSVVMEETILSREGQPRQYERRFQAVFDDKGEVSQVIGYGIDLTDRHRAEEEARLRREQLVQADKLVSLGTLVSGVAHEINNPNQFIMSNAALLAKVWRSALPVLDAYYQCNGDFSLGGVPYSAMRDRVEGAVRDVQDGAGRIKRIVGALCDFARQEPGEFEDLLDLNAVINSALTLLENKLDAATRNFTVHLAGNLPPLRGNFQRVEQIVVNLVLNACHALRSKEEAIRIESLYLPCDRVACLRVCDEGVGIPRDLLSRITDPFFTTRRLEGGTGLGLSVSAAIAREHGGVLTFESELGNGTTATLRLPVHANGANS